MPRLVLTRTLPAPPERVFKAWTDPEALTRWWVPVPGMSCPEAEVDLRVGGRYRITMRNTKGELLYVGGVYREVTPPTRLVYTWSWNGSSDDGVETVVTVEFRAAGDRTELVLTHDGFPDQARCDGHERGWTGCLGHLPVAV
jgi:uncharacterized protein YndB with AHSA1/START domain